MKRLRRLLHHVVASPAGVSGDEVTMEKDVYVSTSTGETSKRRAVNADPMLSGGTEPTNAPTLQPPGFAVDALMVQRFLTEGYVAFRPEASDPDSILTALREMTPPIVASKEAGKALGENPHVAGYAPGYLVLSEPGGQAKTVDGQPTTDYSNDEPKIPALEAMLSSSDVQRTLTAILGKNYLVDADRNSNFTSPGRVDTGGSGGMSYHRDGYGKRRHQHPRMLMGLYYPQAVSLEMGPTSIIARSQFVADFNAGYQAPDIVRGILPKRSPYEGDYGGVIRGAGEGEYFSPPSSFGVQRKVVVPAGTLVIMFYDTWHRATPSLLSSDVDVPPKERDRDTHRWMSKFRFWRMEEPSAPTWDSLPGDLPGVLSPWSPPLDEDVPFPKEYRMDGVGQALFNWMSGFPERHHAPDRYAGIATETLVQRLAWHGDAWCCRLSDDQIVLRTNPDVDEDGVPAELVALQVAYALAKRGTDGCAVLLHTALCGGVNVTAHRQLGQWAAYNAAYGLAAVVPTPEQLIQVVPLCLETLRGNPFGQIDEDLLIAREHAAFALGELCSSAVASNNLRPLLLSSPVALELVLDGLAALCEGIEAPHAQLQYYAVPQYAPLVEAAGSIGQALKAQSLGTSGDHAHAVFALLMRLAAALGSLQHRTQVEEHPTLGISNDVHAAIALARLGLGVDARGVLVGQALAERPGALDLPLMGKSQYPGLKFTVRNT